jgi:putative phage-type endonuclease
MIDQRTPEWHAARLGKVTASKIADVMASGRAGAPSVTRANYLAQLLCERLTGRAAEGYTSHEMQHGTDNEPIAINAYEMHADVIVTPIGFVDHPSIEMSGASPDGLVGTEGLIEVKCPNSATHLATLKGADIDSRYMKQMQWQMACTGRAWCDFVSFDPRMPDHMQLHVQYVRRDAEMIAQIEAAVLSFLADLEADCQRFAKEAA